MNDNIITKMVDRFLGWKLPKNFSPDCGISFKPTNYSALEYPKHWPVGTNLLDAEQAKEMIEYLVGDELDQLRTQLSELQAENERLRKKIADDSNCLCAQLKESNIQLTAMQLYAKRLRDALNDAAVDLVPHHTKTETYRTINEALNSIHPDLSTVENMVFVPQEPTREMLDAAHMDLVRNGDIDSMLKHIYAAMLAAHKNEGG